MAWHARRLVGPVDEGSRWAQSESGDRVKTCLLVWIPFSFPL